MLSDLQVEKFQEIYRKKFGIEISRKDAYAKSIALIRVMEIIYKPMTILEYTKLEEKRKSK